MQKELKEYVGFMNGDIYIRDINNKYLLQDKVVYTPIILEKIDEILKNRPVTSISRIILQALKEVFDIDSVFISPGCRSVVPDNDKLYKYFEEYVKASDIFKKKVYINQKRHNTEVTKSNIVNLGTNPYLLYGKARVCSSKKTS